MNCRLREESGNVMLTREDWLTELFYLLMRDGVPVGVLERLIRDIEEGGPRDIEISYSNGWLARYAKHLADRVRSATTEGGDVQHRVGEATEQR